MFVNDVCLHTNWKYSLDTMFHRIMIATIPFRCPTTPILRFSLDFDVHFKIVKFCVFIFCKWSRSKSLHREIFNCQNIQNCFCGSSHYSTNHKDHILPLWLCPHHTHTYTHTQQAIHINGINSIFSFPPLSFCPFLTYRKGHKLAMHENTFMHAHTHTHIKHAK